MPKFCSLLVAYIVSQKFDIVCFSETYFDSSPAYDDGNLEIAGGQFNTI